MYPVFIVRRCGRNIFQCVCDVLATAGLVFARTFIMEDSFQNFNYRYKKQTRFCASNVGWKCDGP